MLGKIQRQTLVILNNINYILNGKFIYIYTEKRLLFNMVLIAKCKLFKLLLIIGSNSCLCLLLPL